MTLIQRFLYQAEKHADKMAVCDAAGAYTYGEIAGLSAAVAGVLAEKCGKKNERIAILMPRDRRYIPVLLGVLRAGCAAVPIDSEYPAGRIQSINDDAGVRFCISSYALKEKTDGLPVIFAEDLLKTKNTDPESPSIDLSSDENEGFMVYTSGSTGKPKGVIHKAGMLACACDIMTGKYDYSEIDMFCCIAGFNFIASEMDLITPLITGGSTYVASEDERKNTGSIYRIIRKYGVTCMFMPPQLYSVMLSLYGKPGLKCLILSGEKADIESEGENIYEHYGSSETAGVLVRHIKEEAGDKRSLGFAGSGISVFLAGEDGRVITENGVVGELCVKSPYLALGYNNLAKETGEKFYTDPLDGKRVYRSGDMMEYAAGGELIFHGRKDRMIKLRGFRVELAEIENVLESIEEVSGAVCVLKTINGAEKLCCFYEGSTDAAGSLKKKAEGLLPDYMIPDIFVCIEKIPRNDRGKVDFKALEEIEVETEAEFAAPENDTERMICEAFCEVLGAARIGRNDDFFLLGGTSLSVSVLISKLAEAGYDLKFKDISLNQTPSKLAKFISSKQGEKKSRGHGRIRYPVTRTQLGIYLESVTGGNADTYTCSYMMEAAQNITAEELMHAVYKVIDNHPSMKYVIRVGADGLPYMQMIKDAQVDIPVIEGKEKDRFEFMEAFYPVVPLLDTLLFHFAIYRSEKRCYLAIKAHLIFFDGTSISLFISELNSALAGEELLPEGKTIQQIALMEDEMMRDGSFEKAEEYYKKLFEKADDVQTLEGDLGGTLTPGESKNFRYEPKTLSDEKVIEYCRNNSVTPGGFFMGAMSILLGKYLYSNSISFSTVYNGRAYAGSERTFGTLIKRIPFYAALLSDMPVAEYLHSCSRQLFDNMSNDIYSFDEVLKNCPVNDDVEFIYQGDLFTDKMGMGSSYVVGDSVFMEQYHTGMVTGLMSIQLFLTGGFYNMTIEYRNERFSAGWIERFAADLFNVAEALLNEKNVGDIALVTKDDEKLLEKFNDTAIDIDFVPVHEQIKKYALNFPDRQAVYARGVSLSYKELDELSCKVAGSLRAKGVFEGSLVGTLFDRTVYAYAANIGILKSGGAFVPFAADMPSDRLDYCMKNGRIDILLTSKNVLRTRPWPEDRTYEVLLIEDILGAEDAFEYCYVSVKASDLAYCIYTSGTTGLPKGVMIEHGNLANYVNRNEKSIEIMHYGRPGRKCLALAAFSFDVSVVEEFVPLCNGNTVILATEEEIHDPLKLSGLIENTGADSITCTPSFLTNLLDIERSRNALKNITFFDIGAEAFPPELYSELKSIAQGSVILNVYGPTEAAMGCAAKLVNGEGTVTIGAPIANTTFIVADKFDHPLPPGIKGELVICGDQVGRGYIGMSEKTAKAFFEYNGKRAYRSGDLASWTGDGEIVLFGRVDDQVKVRGFRIELSEIERVIGSVKGVRAAAVIAVKGTSEYLAAFYSAAEKIEDDLILEYIKKKLPSYMVPRILIYQKTMPLSANGKIDKKKLTLPVVADGERAFVKPETENEKKICAAFETALKKDAGTVGALDDFFELGGDSLKVMKVVFEAGFDDLTAADVFRFKTPRSISRHLYNTDKRSREAKEDEARLVPHRISPMQEKMIDNQLYKPNSTMWSITHFLARFGSEFEAEKICDALNKAIKNHPGLMVVFGFNEDSELYQQYRPNIFEDVRVREIDEAELKVLTETLVRPFDRIIGSCLFRSAVYKVGDQTYLFMDVHHLIMDGDSLRILLYDMANAYLGKELKKDMYFSIISDAERRALSGDEEHSRKYFEDRYSGIEWSISPVPDIGDGKNVSLGRLEKRLGYDASMVKEAEEYWGVTHSVMAISAALAALHKFNGSDDVMVNWIYNNRMSAESENAVGMLIKNLPAAARFGSIKNTKQLLELVKEQVSAGIANSSYDYILKSFSPFKNDYMEVNIQMGINGDELGTLRPEIIPLKDEYAAANTSLELVLIENEQGDGGFDSVFGYSSGLYSKGYMSDFQKIYTEILEGLIKKEEQV